MAKYKLLTYILYFVTYSFLNAQELPPIEIYTPDIYGANNQNWSISQDTEKHIYFGNNKGLLEFNGEQWVLYESPNKTIIRSVKVIDNLIYTGCYRDFGYWERNQYGILNYTSLSKKKDIAFLEDEEIWNIINIDDFIVFQSLNRLYIFSKIDHNYEIIESKSIINRSFKVNNKVYFQKAKKGLFEIENGLDKLVTNNEILKNNLLVNLFNHKGKLLLQTQDLGFFIFDDNTLKPWNIEANNLLLKDRIYSSTKLKDGSFIVGSISNGIIHITANGKINYQINQNKGLSNNTVLSVFEDEDSNIWLGLEYGINCINIKSAFRIYNDRDGKLGAVNTSIIHNKHLYIGTNRGLFYKPLNTDDKFTFIKGTQGAVWCLKHINKLLFCGHDSGTFIIKDQRAKLISDIPGTWDIKPANNNVNLLIQGNYNGLYVLENTNSNWRIRNKIEGFNVSSRYFEMLDSTNILVSHEYKGVFKLTTNQQLTKIKAVSINNFNKTRSKSSLIKYNNNIIYCTNQGGFIYNAKKNTFEKDSILSELIDSKNYSSGRLVFNKDENKLWSFSSKRISYLTRNRLSGATEIVKIPLPSNARNDIVGYESITPLKGDQYLYGTASGYMIINLKDINYHDHHLKINQVLVSNQKNSNNYKNINIKANNTFENKANNIKIHFNVSNYNKYQMVQYQYKLEGFYNNWSTWNTNSSELFENLPFGSYTFKVRSRIGNKVSSNIESFSFKIKSPWYLSTVALIFYLLFIGLFSVLMHQIYKRYYKKQREKLLLRKQRELELKELENKAQLTRFNNDKLKQDIEAKNRELSISTINIIKKNEFLNNLKKELKKDNTNIKQIVRIIDKNLNNTDDWQLFEEAFNNADKDFLKKIKEKHPELTPNDLRLCTYLRLNLSSKEIAPLLNISPRSVEVKRYRLRKKMNLPHESNLTDYILEI
ncbi:LuxR family transcriptional regulator [Seonamhaeicola algicola]|uniref:LuxR family transcriptional regulator n=1 Tax=Seonamhaeicola algicola TaxID=1719036 RepID=A0A5C7AQQ4_9FLAO|nr:LuxR C-terminal-related transcriptional regulator [Seonamhaeicola algicola]TXE09953.1 LuxR family transcriptional regulator [Seonamhaeicola algicola]